MKGFLDITELYVCFFQLRQEQQQQQQQPSVGDQDPAAAASCGTSQTKETSDISATQQTSQTKEPRKELDDTTLHCKEDDDREIEREREKGKTDLDIIKDLKNELKYVLSLFSALCRTLVQYEWYQTLDRSLGFSTITILE